MAGPHITVCVCTYRRRELLERLLIELGLQETEGLFAYSIVVVDNDASGSAAGVVGDMAARLPVKVVYAVEERQSIALARNRSMALAEGDFIATIDDDEVPVRDWPLRLFRTCIAMNVDGVLGPVVPRYAEEPPGWVRKGRFYDRPRHETGSIVDWKEGRTGNLLFRRSLLEGMPEVFRREFASGGEDRDLFRRWTGGGRRFAWCDEAIVHEFVPAARWSRSFLVRRALLRGKMSLGSSQDRRANLARSLVAVPLYLAALPFGWIAGQHVWMRSVIGLFDHVGRLLAWLGCDPIKEVYITE